MGHSGLPRLGVRHRRRPMLPVRNDQWAVSQASLDQNLRMFCVRLDPGSSEWLHEEEWRIPAQSGSVSIPADAIMGVILGERGWCPAKEGLPDPEWWGRTPHYIWNGQDFDIEAPPDWAGWAALASE